MGREANNCGIGAGPSTQGADSGPKSSDQDPDRTKNGHRRTTHRSHGLKDRAREPTLKMKTQTLRENPPGLKSTPESNPFQICNRVEVSRIFQKQRPKSKYFRLVGQKTKIKNITCIFILTKEKTYFRKFFF